MNILLNGEAFQLDGNHLSALIEHMSLQGKRYAIEVNEEIIPRSEHAEYELHENDKVEIVQAIGGG